MNTGIIEIDLHGLDIEKAKVLIDQRIRQSDRSVYRIRLIHGYHGGTKMKQMIQDEYSYGREPKVIRIEGGWNQGISELVLREM